MRNRNILFTLAMSATLSTAFSQTMDGTRQTPVAVTAATVIPALIRYAGAAQNADSRAQSSATFLIFKDEKGGEPLWTETQSVAFDTAGKYEVYLGASNGSGLPLSLFGTGEARWLEVQIAGEKQQPRVLLTSVPYAMKAADATTLGGLPASAFALAATPSHSIAPATTAAVTPDGTSNVTTTGGTSHYVPVFTGSSTVGNSEIYDTGTSVGIGKEPSAGIQLDVNGAMIMRGNMQVTRTGNATSSKAYPSFGFQFYSNLYNSSTKAADNPYYQLQSEPTGNNTSSPAATFNLLFANDGKAIAETGLYFNPNGTIHFASGQTFDTTSSSGTAVDGASTSGTGVEGTSSSGYGVEGTSNSGTGLYGNSSSSYGVLGTSGSATGIYGLTGGSYLNTAGVYGVAGKGNTSGFSGIAGVWGDATAHVGVFGSSDSYSGVQGTSSTNNGVFGSSGSGPGVSGSSTSGPGGQFSSSGALATVSASNSGSAQGLFATSVADNSEAIYGYAQGAGGIGVYGISGSGGNANGPSVGVEGYGANNGVYGVSPAGIGVYGVMSSASATGTYFRNDSDGAAIWADTSENGDSQGETAISAILGTADNLSVEFLENNSNDFPTLSLDNNGSGGSGLDISSVMQANGAHGMCGIGGNGDLSCTGQVKTLSTTSSARTVETYAMQSPENWMEDFGSASLSSGKAVVSIDPAFAETANTGADYHVFLTARGDSDGLYVTDLTATSFEVHESKHGSSSMGFDYRIVAKRRGYETQRLTDVTERLRKETARVSRFQQIAKDAKTSGNSKPGTLRLPSVPLSALQTVHRAIK